MKRIDGRAENELRPLKIKENYLAHPVSSVLFEQGGTKVIAAVSVDPKVPAWMRAQKVTGGWLTCEYGLLPASTNDRNRREAAAGKQGGRTMEIQRLIGRSLRAVVDLKALGENTLYVDCDVIDADGGTRCAGISGASLALAYALRSKLNAPEAMKELVAAVSVGIVDGVPMLDLKYEEDSNAEVDMNVVMTESGRLIEIQGTAEKTPFNRKQLNELLDLAEHGLKQIFAKQHTVLDKLSSGANPGAFGSLGDALKSVQF